MYIPVICRTRKSLLSQGGTVPRIEEKLIKDNFSKSVFFNLEFIVKSESEEIILIALMVFEL